MIDESDIKIIQKIHVLLNYKKNFALNNYIEELYDVLDYINGDENKNYVINKKLYIDVNKSNFQNYCEQIDVGIDGFESYKLETFYNHLLKDIAKASNKNQYKKILSYIKSQRYNINIKNYDNFECIENDIKDQLESLKSFDVLNELIKRGLYLNYCDDEGNTVLHKLMYENENPLIIKYLANKYKIDINKKNNKGVDVLSYLKKEITNEERELIFYKNILKLSILDVDKDDRKNSVYKINNKKYILNKMWLRNKKIKLINHNDDNNNGLRNVYYNLNLNDEVYIREYNNSVNKTELHNGYNFLTLALYQRRDNVVNILLKEKIYENYVKENPEIIFDILIKSKQCEKLFKENHYLLKLKNNDGNNIYHLCLKYHFFEIYNKLIDIDIEGNNQLNNNNYKPIDYIKNNKFLLKKEKENIIILIEKKILENYINLNESLITNKKEFKI